ncbi:MAG: hypothetical protein JWO30_4674 [Fibrobacteres bacterium]|nr:hypothetical protein [Fibrobacterota bacterium]
MKCTLAAAFFLLITACATDDGENPRSIAGNKYVNTSIGTTLQFPSSWQLKTDYKFGEKTLDLAALAPPIDGFSANVLIGIDPHQGTDNMRDVLTMIKGSILAQYPDVRDYIDTVYQVEGKDVGEMVYTTAVSGKDYRAKSLYFVNKNKEISIIYTDIADRYMTNADFEGIQSSMHLN